MLYEKRCCLVSTKDQHLHGQQQCLHSENNRMDQTDGIHHVQKQGLPQAQIAPFQLFVVTGVGIRNALAPGNDVTKAPGIEWLHDNGQCAWSCTLLRVNEHVCRFELPGGDDRLHSRDDHGNDRKGLRQAHHLSQRARFNHLR